MSDGAPLDAGVYVDLEQLIALEQKGRKVSLLPRQPVHSLLSGRYASRMRGRGLNFEEIRDYRSGDDVRSIDWKVTARLQSPHVRVFDEERDRLGVMGAVQWSRREQTKHIYVADVSASDEGLKTENPTDTQTFGPPAAQSSVMSMELRSSPTDAYKVASTQSWWRYREPVTAAGVAYLVDESGVPVDRQQVATCLAPDEERGDREVLPRRTDENLVRTGQLYGSVGHGMHSHDSRAPPTPASDITRATCRERP